MRFKLGIIAAAAGTLVAATATTALASVGVSGHAAPTPTTSASGKPAHVASSGYGKPVPTVSWHSTPAATAPATVAATSAPATTPPVTTPPATSKPVPTKTAHTKPVPTKTAHTKPAPTKTFPTKPAGSAPATAPATPVPTVTAHSVPGYGKPVHAKMITLTAADNGKTVRVAKGEKLMVKLVVKVKQNPDATTWWHAVNASGDALKALSPALVTKRGVTDARYDAVARGTATLSSSRAVCAQKTGTPTCHSMQGWQATIVVR